MEDGKTVVVNHDCYTYAVACACRHNPCLCGDEGFPVDDPRHGMRRADEAETEPMPLTSRDLQTNVVKAAVDFVTSTGDSAVSAHQELFDAVNAWLGTGVDPDGSLGIVRRMIERQEEKRERDNAHGEVPNKELSDDFNITDKPPGRSPAWPQV